MKKKNLFMIEAKFQPLYDIVYLSSLQVAQELIIFLLASTFALAV